MHNQIITYSKILEHLKIQSDETQKSLLLNLGASLRNNAVSEEDDFRITPVFYWLKDNNFESTRFKVMKELIQIARENFKAPYARYWDSLEGLKNFDRNNYVNPPTVMWTHCIIEDYLLSQLSYHDRDFIRTTRWACRTLIKEIFGWCEKRETHLNYENAEQFQTLLTNYALCLKNSKTDRNSEKMSTLRKIVKALRHAKIEVKQDLALLEERSRPKRLWYYPEVEVQRIKKFLSDMDTGYAIAWDELGFSPKKDAMQNNAVTWSKATQHTAESAIVSVWEEICKRLKIQNAEKKEKFKLRLILHEDIGNSPYLKTQVHARWAIGSYLAWYATQDFCDEDTRNHLRKVLKRLPSPKIEHKCRIKKVYLSPLDLVLSEQPLIDHVIEKNKRKVKVFYRGCSLERLRSNEMAALKWISIPREHNRVKRLPNNGFPLDVLKSKGGYGNTDPDSPLLGLPAFADVIDELLEDAENRGWEEPPDDAYVISPRKGWSSKPYGSRWFYRIMNRCKAERLETQIHEKKKDGNRAKAATPHDLGRIIADIMDRLMPNYGEREKFLDFHGRWAYGAKSTRKTHYLPPKEYRVYQKATLECIGFPWDPEKCKDWMVKKGCDPETGAFPEMLQEPSAEEKSNCPANHSSNVMAETEALIKIVEAENKNLQSLVDKGALNKKKAQRDILRNLEKLREYRRDLEMDRKNLHR